MDELDKRLKVVEEFIKSLKGINNFPVEVKNALISLGFIFSNTSVSYKGGIGGSSFEKIFIKYLNKYKIISVTSMPFSFVVNSLSANTCSFVGTDANPIDIGEKAVELFTSDTLPGGLDVIGYLIMINPTSTTFQLSYDGTTPLDITSIGVGTQYLSII